MNFRNQLLLAKKKKKKTTTKKKSYSQEMVHASICKIVLRRSRRQAIGFCRMQAGDKKPSSKLWESVEDCLACCYL